MLPTYAFTGVPGGVSMTIVLVATFLSFVVPLVVASAIAVHWYRRTSDSDDSEVERITELE